MPGCWSLAQRRPYLPPQVPPFPTLHLPNSTLRVCPLLGHAGGRCRSGGGAACPPSPGFTRHPDLIRWEVSNPLDWGPGSSDWPLCLSLPECVLMRQCCLSEWGHYSEPPHLPLTPGISVRKLGCTVGGNYRPFAVLPTAELRIRGLTTGLRVPRENSGVQKFRKGPESVRAMPALGP